MPPAFNLSQDQTLQFKVCSCLWQPILLTQDHIGIDVILSSIFGLRQNSTEHPHKLPDQIVKERAAFSTAKTVNSNRPPIRRQSLASTFSRLPRPRLAPSPQQGARIIRATNQGQPLSSGQPLDPHPAQYLTPPPRPLPASSSNEGAAHYTHYYYSVNGFLSAAGKNDDAAVETLLIMGLDQIHPGKSPLAHLVDRTAAGRADQATILQSLSVDTHRALLDHAQGLGRAGHQARLFQ